MKKRLSNWKNICDGEAQTRVSLWNWCRTNGALAGNWQKSGWHALKTIDLLSHWEQPLSFFPFRLSALVAKMLLQLSAVEYLEAPQNRNEKQSTYWTPAPHQMYVLTGFPTTACLGVTTKHTNTWPTASLDSLTCSFIITPLWWRL